MSAQWLNGGTFLHFLAPRISSRSLGTPVFCKKIGKKFLIQVLCKISEKVFIIWL